MSSFLFDVLVLVLSCQAIAMASSVQGEKRKLVRSEKGKRQQGVPQQDGSNVALELGSSGGLTGARIFSAAEASRKDARLQTVGAHDVASAVAESASIGARQSQQDRSEGEHSEAFTKAHDAIVTELKLKEATLADWLSVNCITSKETDLANKQKEIMDYKGESDYWWESAWSAVKRMWLNLWFDKANRLLQEEAKLQAELDGMKAEKARLEKEVADMVEKKNTHVDEGNVLLDGLNSQVTALIADLAAYRSDKATVQSTHNALKENTIAEDAAAVDVFTQLIANLDAEIHEKRDIYYSVTATCAQFEKDGKDECRKCTSDKRACGDTCISKSERCNTFPGCACDATIGHELHEEFNETRTALEDTIKDHEASINSHSNLLNQTQTDIEKITADKAIADKAFDTEKNRLEALKTQLEKDKSIAEDAKQNATNSLSSATEENEAAVSALASELRNAILALMASKAENLASKSALLAAQATKMKELLETHAATIAAWDAKILAAETEKANLQTEAGDLSTAIGATMPTKPGGGTPQLIVIGQTCSQNNFREMTEAECQAYGNQPYETLPSRYDGKNVNPYESGCIMWSYHRRRGVVVEFQQNSNGQEKACPDGAYKCICMGP